MDTPGRFGQHLVTQDGDLVKAQIVGAVSRAEAVAFHDMLAQLLAEHGRCYLLVDLTRLASISPEARRYVGEWNRTHRVTAGAAFGASFPARAAIMLLLNAVRLMNRDAPEIFLARDETEARRWLAARRAEPP